MRCNVKKLFGSSVISVALASVMTFGTQTALADDADVTLIHLSDVHCHMAPHDEDFLKSGNRVNSGGVARLATGIKQIREEVGEENSALFMVGDATHGGAECMFTMGNAIMPVFNSLGIDGFVPGNWDFAYGKNATRNRFANGSEKMSPNNQTTLSNTIPECTGKATVADGCDVVRATFPTVANNVYSFGEKKQGAARKINLNKSNRVLPPYVITEVNGVKIAYVGITTTRLPVQNPLFNLTFRFTKGHDELPGDIADARAEGAEIVVLATELGLGDVIQIAKEVDGIDIILSGDTHETSDPIVVTRASGEKTYIVESGEDAYLGRLDFEVEDGKVEDFKYELLEMTDEVEEDPAVKAMVDAARAPFLDLHPMNPNGKEKCVMYGPGGFPYGKGHKLCTSLDEVVGYTEVELERRDVIGDFMNNFIGDAALYAGKTIANLTDENAFGITNGFRYDIPILAMNTPLDGLAKNGKFADGAITVGELYNYIPIVPAASLMDYTGGLLRGRYEAFLEGIFDPHPFRHQGGWWMGFSSNMHFVLDLESAPNSVPLSTLGGRILEMKVGAEKINPSKIYTVISCYPHGESADRQCRTSGGRNLRFFCGDFIEDNVTQSNIGVCPSVYDPAIHGDVVDVNRAPVVRQVAPDNYVAPVQMLREYLKTLPNNTITAAQFGPQRKSTDTVAYSGCPTSPPALDKNCDGVPDSDFSEVQPAFGAGPSWLGRGDFGATVENMTTP